jgi:hypothetical protein
MKYTHIDLSELCDSVNSEIDELKGSEILLVKPNGGTTSVLAKDVRTGFKTPLLEDVTRDVGYGFLKGYYIALKNIPTYSSS